jgi:TRAP-type C4-dicarboxylate transport system permease small subunit
MHANRHQVLKLETERFILRFLSLVFGFLCIRYFLHQPLPYSMDLARRGARQWSIHNGLDMLWAVVIIAFMFAVFTIFLRLIMLRPRLFGSNYASEE